MRRQSTVFLLLGLVLIAFQRPGPVDAHGLCCGEPNTLVEDVGKADFVVVGKFTNARRDGGVNKDGKTDFTIETIIKKHKVTNDIHKIVIDRYVDEPKAKFLICCLAYDGKLDAYRAIRVDDAPDVLPYLTGALKLKDRPVAERLAYCFHFLNSKDSDVSRDAHREFHLSNYRDYRELARELDPKVLIDWLDDPRMPPDRVGLYARLFGDCGKGAEHGGYLRKLILNPNLHKGHGRDCMLEGYIMIQPKEGWTFLQNEILHNPKSEFSMRYAGIQALRFLYSQRPDLVDKKVLIGAMLEATTIPDIEDFAIEDLRKWRSWETTDKILALAGRKSHSVGVIQHAILRFAIQSPSPAAAAYVAAQRKRDPDQVRETEECLKDKSEPAAVAPSNGK